MRTVGIIGGSGFIGSYVTKIFLEENFKVKVSTTDITKTMKYEHLFTLANNEYLRICPLDVLDIPSIELFVEDCDIIIHGGTPFKLDIKDPNAELLEPTIKGTENFLQAVSKSKALHKVVFIASIAAWNTSFPLNPATYRPAHIFSEQDNPYVSEDDHPFAQAKYLADQAVRKFTRDNPDLHFEITTISPAMVIGNSLSERSESAWLGLQQNIRGKIAANPFIEKLLATNTFFAMTDVRDVAESVYQAAIKNGIHGKNYLIANESYRISDVSRMLNKEPPLSGPEYFYDSSLAKKELGLAFISSRESLNGFL